jgi:hypothetical protein
MVTAKTVKKCIANTVTRIENGSDAKQSTIAALENAGVAFNAENGGGAGVRLKKPQRATSKRRKGD